MKAEDRLLFIPDHKQSARLRFRASAVSRKEFPRKLGNNPPLVRTRILAFIHEDVVDSAVKFVQHPLRGLARLQQANRCRDQIVIIQCRAITLRLLIAIQNRECCLQQRLGQIRGHATPSAVVGRDKSFLKRLEILHQGRLRTLQFLRDQL